MPLSGLYAITDPQLCPGPQLLDAATAALQGGARCLQYRDKSASAIKQQAQAAALKRLCAEYEALFFINDDVELALAVNADGVHLGQRDGDIRTARKRLGNKLLGITCHGDLQLAHAAVHAGADYLAFGRFYPSLTKPDAPPCSLATLTQARSLFGLPLLAIGGITPDNGGPLLAAGADMLAAINGVFAAADIRTAAQRYTDLFKTNGDKSTNAVH